MMRKALLADDDFLVRSYLKMLPSWEQAGFEILSDVRDGEEALETLAKERVDLVVTDIAMPLMDGIELIREIRKKYPDTYVIVLSCHDDFEYVKEAMKEGADEYVLKNTLNEESLRDLLQAAAKKLDGQGREIPEPEKSPAGEEPQEEFTKINRKFMYFNQILSGRLTGEKKEEKRLRAGIRGKYQNSAVIVMKVENERREEDPWAEVRQEQYCMEFLGRFQKAMRRMTTDSTTEWEVIYLGSGSFCCFIDLSDSYKGSVMYQKLTNLASGCYKICAGEEYHFQIGVSSICIGAEAIRQAYQQAREMVKAGFYEQDFIVYYEPERKLKKELPKEARLLLKKTGELQQKNDKDSFLKMAENVVKTFTRNRTERETVIQWLKKLSQYGLEGIGIRYGEIRRIDEVSTALSKIADCLFDYQGREIPEEVSDVVKTAVRYAKKHYRESIGLNDAAEAAGVNSTYLSYLFGKEMGVGFVNYLLGLRLAYARKLLVETNLKIGTIGKQAGFHDYHYFAKVFKKAEGVSPAQYRREKR